MTKQTTIVVTGALRVNRDNISKQSDQNLHCYSVYTCILQYSVALLTDSEGPDQTAG